MFQDGQNLHVLGLIKTSLRHPKESKKCKGNDTSTSPSFCSPHSDSSGHQSCHLHQSLSSEAAFIIHLPEAMLSHKNSVLPPEYSGRQPVQADAVLVLGSSAIPGPVSKSQFSQVQLNSRRGRVIPFSSFVHLIMFLQRPWICQIRINHVPLQGVFPAAQ